MFVMGNFLSMVALVLDFVFQALMLILLVNAVLSWFQPKPSHPIVDLLDRVSDFVCEPVRRLFPTAMGGIDFAPLVVMLRAARGPDGPTREWGMEAGRDGTARGWARQ